jgi:hypothetical protein
MIDSLVSERRIRRIHRDDCARFVTDNLFRRPSDRFDLVITSINLQWIDDEEGSPERFVVEVCAAPLDKRALDAISGTARDDEELPPQFLPSPSEDMLFPNRALRAWIEFRRQLIRNGRPAFSPLEWGD